MISLSEKDWTEIYYALEGQINFVRDFSVPSEKKAWIEQLKHIQKIIGPDGEKASKEGVEPS